MTDLTPILNEVLKGHDARPTADPALTLKNIDEFLKEAYQIVGLPACKDTRYLAHLYRRMRTLPLSTPT